MAVILNLSRHCEPRFMIFHQNGGHFLTFPDFVNALPQEPLFRINRDFVLKHLPGSPQNENVFVMVYRPWVTTTLRAPPPPPHLTHTNFFLNLDMSKT